MLRRIIFENSHMIVPLMNPWQKLLIYVFKTSARTFFHQRKEVFDFCKRNFWKLINESTIPEFINKNFMNSEIELL